MKQNNGQKPISKAKIIIIIVFTLLVIFGGIYFYLLFNKSTVNITKTDKTGDELIGGQRDEHGCLGPAGYSWDEKIGACIREWELDEDQRRAAKIAVADQGKGYGLVIVSVEASYCQGCYIIKLKKEGSEAIVGLRSWRVVEREEDESRKDVNDYDETEIDKEDAVSVVARLAAQVLGIDSEQLNFNNVQVKAINKGNSETLTGKGIGFGDNLGSQQVTNMHEDLIDFFSNQDFAADELPNNNPELISNTIIFSKQHVVCNVIKVDIIAKDSSEVEIRCADREIVSEPI